MQKADSFFMSHLSLFFKTDVTRSCFHVSGNMLHWIELLNKVLNGSLMLLAYDFNILALILSWSQLLVSSRSLLTSVTLFLVMITKSKAGLVKQSGMLASSGMRADVDFKIFVMESMKYQFSLFAEALTCSD